MRRVLGALGVVIAPFALEAQSQPQSHTGWRWEVGVGPLVSFGSRLVHREHERFSYTPSDTLVWNACDGKFHLMTGLSRTLGTSALTARINLAYNRCEGSARQNRPSYGVPSRNALTDELYLLETGLQWDALPTRTVSPYLLTMVGVGHSRIGWSRDSSSNGPDAWRYGWGPTFATGAGLRVRVARRELFAEWRWRYRPESLNSARSLPITIGVRF